MKISELVPGQGKIEIEAKVSEKGDVRTFEKFGKQGKVCNAKIKDDTGEITLSLWNEQVDNVNVGDIVKIGNGYVSEYKGQMQLSTGKFGTLEIIDMSTKDHGEHILTNDEIEEAEAINQEIPEPEPEDEVTEDEMNESEIIDSKKYDDLDVDIEEEKVD
ncbi:MAG: OB-fold nucleic acid binding domain-containing protein [Candidatus Woesearchaeota archaeon]